MKTHSLIVSIIALLATLPLSAARLFEPQQGIPLVHESVNSEGRPAVVPSEPDQLGGLVWIWSEEPDQPYFRLRASYLSAAGKRIFERSIDLDTVPEKALLVFVSSGTASACVFRMRWST